MTRLWLTEPELSAMWEDDLLDPAADDDPSEECPGSPNGEHERYAEEEWPSGRRILACEYCTEVWL